MNLEKVFFFIWTKKENWKLKLNESFITFSNSFRGNLYSERERVRERERERES